ncbi:MAG: hypothetical protein JO072_15495 [Parafilimonas sp.]|nr:hypothetical protein [Parafilimonas sp.]
MEEQKDRRLETPGEANRDKHINFLAEENGDVDPASENDNDNNDENVESADDNGFFSDDDNELQTKEEHEEDKSKHPSSKGKVIPLDPDTNTTTIEDRISVNKNNDDLLTLVKDDDSNPYENEDNQPR